ncbi:MAG: hypothetical protein HY059_22870 [Proteobacteria bacterium]|nr:hypothetical protein [Pseudomonadota bacterium]
MVERVSRWFQRDIVVIGSVLGVLLAVPFYKYLTSGHNSGPQLKARAKPKLAAGSPEAKAESARAAKKAMERRLQIADPRANPRTIEEQEMMASAKVISVEELESARKARTRPASMGAAPTARAQLASAGGIFAAGNEFKDSASFRGGGGAAADRRGEAMAEGGVHPGRAGGAMSMLQIAASAQVKRHGVPSSGDGKALAGNKPALTLGENSPAYTKARTDMEHRLDLQWTNYKPANPGKDETHGDRAKTLLIAELRDASYGSGVDHLISSAKNEDEALEKEVEKTDNIRGQIDALAVNIQGGAAQLFPMQGQAEAKAQQKDKDGCQNIKTASGSVYGMFKAECTHGWDLVKRCSVEGDAITDRFRNDGWDPARDAERSLCNRSAGDLSRACSAVDAAYAAVQGVNCDKPK